MADRLTGAARPETLEECGGLLDQFCLLERSVREHLLFAIEWYADTRVVAAEAAAEARGHERGIKEWRDIADKYTLKWDAELVRRVAAERALQSLFSHIEAGDLVRNTARDDEPAFAIRSMNLVMALKRAHDILSGNAAPQATPLEPRFEHTHAETFRDAQASPSPPVVQENQESAAAPKAAVCWICGREKYDPSFPADTKKYCWRELLKGGASIYRDDLCLEQPSDAALPEPRSLVGTLYEPCTRCGRTKGEHRDLIGGGLECPAAKEST